jgi:hypothetical protein
MQPFIVFRPSLLPPLRIIRNFRQNALILEVHIPATLETVMNKDTFYISSMGCDAV